MVTPGDLESVARADGIEAADGGGHDLLADAVTRDYVDDVPAWLVRH
jgi:hypothetical protein